MKRFIACKKRKTAEKRAPWASFIAKCDGGYMAFEFMSDYDLWRNEQ
jgi:hypothetical protein